MAFASTPLVHGKRRLPTEFGRRQGQGQVRVGVGLKIKVKLRNKVRIWVRSRARVGVGVGVSGGFSRQELRLGGWIRR